MRGKREREGNLFQLCKCVVLERKGGKYYLLIIYLENAGFPLWYFLIPKVQFENANMQKSSLNSAVSAAILIHLFNDIFFPCFRNEPAFFNYVGLLWGLSFYKKKQSGSLINDKCYFFL